MSPVEHLAWFEENIRWFEALPIGVLSEAVPRCPGWSVESVFTHLALGLGLAYPVALTAPPDADDAAAFASVAWPASVPREQAAVETFGLHMNACLATFRATDPESPCFTYAGPGVAGFWFRRAAIETTLHRMDVADALDQPITLAHDRAADAVDEAVQFVIPLAAALAGQPDGSLTIETDRGTFRLGQAEPIGTIRGDDTAVFTALWGRNPQIEATGPVADWLHLVEHAFAGR